MKVIKTIISLLKFVRYNSKALSITSIIASSIFNVVAMTPPSVKFEEMHPFAGNQKAMDYYKSETWNENLTLKENQDNLVKKFMEKCCEVDPYKVICNEYRQPVFEIRSEYNAFAEQMLKKIAQFPVGCELLRAILSKYLAKPEIDRIRFAKKFEGYRTFSFFTNGWNNLFVLPGIPGKESSMVDEQKECHCVKRNKNLQFELDQIKLPLDCVFFHEMIHWMHAIDSEFDPAGDDKYFRETEALKKAKAEMIPDIYKRYILKTPEEYRTMFGLIKKGDKFFYDSINEASYLYCKTGHIRISHIFQMQNIPSALMGNLAFLCGDQEAWEYIIQRSSTPEFGKGQYKCSDLKQ